MDNNTFTETHSRRIKQLTFEVLTILVLGLLLNLLASIGSDWLFDPAAVWSGAQKVFTFFIIVSTLLSVYSMIRLRMPGNVLRRVAYCNLL